MTKSIFKAFAIVIVMNGVSSAQFQLETQTLKNLDATPELSASIPEAKPAPVNPSQNIGMNIINNLANNAQVANGSTDIRPFDPRRFNIEMAVAKLNKELPNSRYYKYATIVGLPQVIQALPQIADQIGEDEVKFVIRQLNALYRQGMVLNVVARFQTDAAEDYYDLRYHINIYTTTGQLVELNYSAGC